MLTDPTFRSQLIPLAVEYLKNAGFAVDPLLEELDIFLDPGAPEVELPLSRLHAFFERAEVLAGDPFLGVHLAERRPVGAHGMLEYVWRNAPTLRDGLTHLAKFSRMLNDQAEIRFEESGAFATFRQTVPAHRLGVGRHGSEFLVAALLLEMRRLTSFPCMPHFAFFPHARPEAGTDELARVIGTADLGFGADGAGARFSRALLDLPFERADPRLYALLRADVQQRLDLSAQTRSDPMAELRDAVRVRLRSGEATVSAIAALAGTSRRTIQRRLKEANTSLRDLVEQARHADALLMIERDDLSIEEIGRRLGYADATAFLRAFHRWTGTTPGQLRKARTLA